MRGIGILLSLGLDKRSGFLSACAVGYCSKKTTAANHKLRIVRLAVSEIRNLVSIVHALLRLNRAGKPVQGPGMPAPGSCRDWAVSYFEALANFERSFGVYAKSAAL